MRTSTVLTAIRIILAIVFIAYGTVKVLGGQYYYGDWVIDRKTVEGPSLVWAFFGYSPVYGRFTGLFELVPGILPLIPRTATIGAAALFAVSLNITVMDFAYGYPAVWYFALLYTVLLGVLLWADRQKFALLMEDSGRVRVALFDLTFANILAASLSERPTVAATKAAVVGAGTVDTVTVRTRKVTGFFPWRVEAVERG